MSFAQSSSQNRFTLSASLTAAAFLALSPALLPSSAAVADQSAISTRIESKRVEQRKALPTMAALTPSSQITRSSGLKAVKAMERPKAAPVSTRPAKVRRRVATRLVGLAKPSPSPVTAAVAASSSTPVVPLQATVSQPIVAAPSVLASRTKNPALIATIEKPKTADNKVDSKQADADKILLAQIDKDLLSTQTRLTSTNQKLSAGQKQLMSFSSTLRSAIIEAGDDGAGLHPFVRVASRYAGTPYVWGGESRYGFDCSGFIIRVMRDLGYKALPHSAAEQFKYGQPIAQGLLKPGDIVFFANTYKPGISHVGIYIGKRRFIHAASTREGTIVSSLDASPYKQKYAGARRLLAVKKESLRK